MVFIHSNQCNSQDNNLLLSLLSAIPGNITSSLPGVVYECVARVNNATGNELVMFPGIALKTDNKKFIVYRPAILLAIETSYLATNNACFSIAL